MTNFPTRLRNASAALALVLSATPVFAATATVQVKEDGDGGSAMTLTLQPQTVKAGKVKFRVENDATAEEHEMIVVRLKNPDQAVPLNAKKGKVDEAKLDSLGEVEDIKPGASGELTAKLTPGTYLLFCNIKGHYQAGMHGTLTVTP